jgi:methylphosphotriester-DNA--protein-cysteine methyltransferase
MALLTKRDRVVVIREGLQVCFTMSEVKKSPSGNLGLFASKSFHTGNVIMQETPIIVLAPSPTSEGESPKPSALVKVPSSIDAWFHGTFRSMVQAGLCWMKQQEKEEKDEKAILELYFPTNESSCEYEKDVLKVAEEAAEYLRKTKPENKDWETVEKVMLIWAFNSFERGRIYPKMSRVNHNCNPNAIIQPDGEAQKLVAAADIAEGDEISISYLGSLLYTDTQTRNERLRQTKFFECKCDRCSSEDTAARIPCPSCHPRQPQQSLNEDVQYDDDQTVQYVTPFSPCSKCNSKLDKSSKQSKFISTVISKIVSYLESQEASTAKKGTESNTHDDEVLEEHVGLASTIMGDKHWTTNLMILLHLDRRLSSMSSAMLTAQEMPEMEEVAEAIDSLERVHRFVESLNLKLHPGHMLGDVIIGTARTLVSLGDVKSQKYGAEWLDKITDYVNKFESEGRQKVLSTLSMAWKKNSRDDKDESEQATKKMKTK